MTIGAREEEKAARRAANKQAAAEREAAERRRRAFTGMIVAVLAIGAFVGLLALTGVFSPAKPDSTASTADASAPAGSAAPKPQVSLDPALSTKPVVTKGEGAAPTKLVVKTLVQGTGDTVKAGQTITVNYVGVNYATGEEFDASWKRNQPFVTAIGTRAVIAGWDQGLVGVKVGSRVLLDIPADLAYGASQTSGPTSGALRFVVDILAAE